VGAVLADPHIRFRRSTDPMRTAEGPDLDAGRVEILRDWLG